MSRRPFRRLLSASIFAFLFVASGSLSGARASNCDATLGYLRETLGLDTYKTFEGVYPIRPFLDAAKTRGCVIPGDVANALRTKGYEVASLAQSGQETSLAIDVYKCSDFLSDIAMPDDGARLLRSLMMIGWAAGYASGYQKNDGPRADPKSVQMISAILGDACRRDPTATAVQALVGSLKDFAKSSVRRP